MQNLSRYESFGVTGEAQNLAACRSNPYKVRMKSYRSMFRLLGYAENSGYELWLVSNFNFVEIFLFWVELRDNVNKIMRIQTRSKPILIFVIIIITRFVGKIRIEHQICFAFFATSNASSF